MIPTTLRQVPEVRQKTLQTSVRELDHRMGDGIGVTLRWDPLTNGMSAVRDERLGESLAFRVDGADAVCAFHHPCAFAANLGVADGPDHEPYPKKTT